MALMSVQGIQVQHLTNSISWLHCLAASLPAPGFGLVEVNMISEQLNLDSVKEVSGSYRGITHHVKRSKVRLPKGMTADYVLTLASELLWEMVDASDVAVTSPAKAKEVFNEWLIHRYSNKDIEVFGVVWMDNQNNVICFRELHFGTIDGAVVYPREVVKSAIAERAKSCIFYHNHPGEGFARVMLTR
jgi:hypothetical protein